MRNTSKLLVCVCGCSDFCAIMCGKPLKNVCAGACVNHVLGPHVCFAFLLHKIFIFFTILSQLFLFFLKVRMLVLAQKMVCGCVRCTLSKYVRCECAAKNPRTLTVWTPVLEKIRWCLSDNIACNYLCLKLSYDWLHWLCLSWNQIR